MTESAIVSQFLADLRPSHLLPASLSSPQAPLVRARINYFVDTWFSKCNGFTYPIYKMNTLEEKQAESKKWAETIEKEIEPLLKDANPYFGGSSRMTLAEVRLSMWLSLPG